jgi:Cys-rich protein (TIGR01571 family)
MGSPNPTSALTPIDPRPQSVFTSLGPSQPQPPSYLSATYPHEKEPPSPLSSHHNTHPTPFSPVSPMIGVTRIQTQQPPQHSRQRSNLSPINTNVGQYSMPPMPPTPHSYQSETASALPSKTPITPISPGPTKKDPANHQVHLSTNVPTSHATEPYSPHGLTSPTRHGTVFSPDSAHGPNGLDFALHQPGQIAHPNMDLSGKGSSHEWKHSLCECGDLSTCLTGLFCPCILYGRTSYRLSQRSAKKDPTDMLSYKTTNKHCIVMGAACGLWGLFPMLQRTRIRHIYKLEGSVCGDALRGCCCCCCTSIQNEREMKEREENSRRFAGPSDVYGKKEVMSYTPQR